MSKQGIRQFNPSDSTWGNVEEAYIAQAVGYWKLVTVAKGKGRPLKEGFKPVWIWEGTENDFPDEWKETLLKRLEIDDLELVDLRICFKDGSPTLLKDVYDRGAGKPRMEELAAYYPILLVHNTIPTAVGTIQIDEDALIQYAETHGSGDVSEYDLDPPEVYGIDESPTYSD